MSNFAASRLVRKTVHWLLAATTAFYLVTGVGITQYRVVESITFGLLTKSLAFKIHEFLWIPFCLLLLGHIYLALAGSRLGKGQK